MKKNPSHDYPHTLNAVCAGLLLTLSTGCASIFSPTKYPVTVTSTPLGATVTITDRFNREFHAATTPFTLKLNAGDGYFSPARYNFKFEKEGYTTATQTLEAEMEPWYIGNVCIGGLIGFLIVDPVTGAMWQLPDTVNGVLRAAPEGTGTGTGTRTGADTSAGTGAEKNPEPSIAERLKELQDLLKDGHISQEEHDAAAEKLKR